MEQEQMEEAYEDAFILLNAALHQLEKTEIPKGSSEICDGIRSWFRIAETRDMTIKN